MSYFEPPSHVVSVIKKYEPFVVKKCTFSLSIVCDRAHVCAYGMHIYKRMEWACMHIHLCVIRIKSFY